MSHEENRFGSAREATQSELKRAGIIGINGAAFGYDQRKKNPLSAPNDASLAIFGGAGSGKSAGPYAQTILNNHVGNFICFDPRGELTATTMLANSIAGYEVYVINPTGMLGFPNHTCNVHSHQTIDSPSLIADTQKSAMDYCPVPTEGGRSNWVPEDAQDWLTQLFLFATECNDTASMDVVYLLLNAMQDDLDQWTYYLEQMQLSRFSSVRRFAGAIMQLQQEGRESFTAPYGTLQTTLKFMQDDRMAKTISGDDFKLEWLNDPHRKVRVFVILPIEYLRVWAPAVRQIFGKVIQDKLRNPSAHKVSVLIDECGQLGHFDSCVELYTFGRGAGLLPMCSWQEISQLNENYGSHLAQAIVGSATIRAFSGVRTMQTAKLVSEMAGTMTLEYDDVMAQSDAKRRKQEAAYSALKDGSILNAAAQIRHYREAERHQTKQARKMFEPDEVMNLSPGQMVAFASGLTEGVIQGHWCKYFERGDTAGTYLPNPYHDAECVTIKSRFGSKKVPMLTERVPSKLARLPQYANGLWQYIKGYRPNVGA